MICSPVHRFELDDLQHAGLGGIKGRLQWPSGDLLAQVPQETWEEVRPRPMACRVEGEQGSCLLGRAGALFPIVREGRNPTVIIGPAVQVVLQRNEWTRSASRLPT